MKTDSFFQTAFGNLYIDTASYGGKPSYEIFILGSLNFLHFNLAKEFWNNQEGGGVAIFQSEKPGQKDSLIIAGSNITKTRFMPIP